MGARTFTCAEVRKLKSLWYKNLTDAVPSGHRNSYFLRFRREIEDFLSQCKCKEDSKEVEIKEDI